MSEKSPKWVEKEWIARKPNAVACATCMFRATVFNGMQLDRADTDSCGIYEFPESKPSGVYWDGADCEFYEPANDSPLSLLLGVAVGDALGVPFEFKQRGSFQVTGMQGHGTHNQPAGTWSDDTSLTLALADTLFVDSCNLGPIAWGMRAWYEKGVYTPHGKVFDIGGTTERAIKRLEEGVSPEKSGGTEEKDNGNGSLMRISPLVFYMYGIEDSAARFRIVKKVSSITHAHEISVAACFIYLEMLNQIRKGRSKEEAYSKLQGEFSKSSLISKETLAKFGRILQGDPRSLPEKEIRSGTYVVDTLEAALWCFLTTKSYKEAVLKAVNLGDDSDTTGAVTGALAGLAYGTKSIPKDWIDQLANLDEIKNIAIKMPRWDLFRQIPYTTKD